MHQPDIKKKEAVCVSLFPLVQPQKAFPTGIVKIRVKQKIKNKRNNSQQRVIITSASLTKQHFYFLVKSEETKTEILPRATILLKILSPKKSNNNETKNHLPEQSLVIFGEIHADQAVYGIFNSVRCPQVLGQSNVHHEVNEFSLLLGIHLQPRLFPL